MVRRLPLAMSAALLVGAYVAAEWVHYRASFRRLGGQGASAAGSEAVLVLGYKNRGERANSVNRQRVRAGLRSLDPAGGGTLIVSGGSVASTVSEAELMAAYARERGYASPLLREEESRSTWENIRDSAPLLEDFARIKIVSNPLHAEVARAYLWQQRPDLARRLVRAEDYRCGETPHLIIPAAIVGLIGLKRLVGAHPQPRDYLHADRESGRLLP